MTEFEKLKQDIRWFKEREANLKDIAKDMRSEWKERERRLKKLEAKYNNE